MRVCIAEKPSVAREIARIVGADKRKDGYYEGNGYQVTWTFGHLCTLKEPRDYDSVYKMWHLSLLPILPRKHGIKLMDDQGVQKQFATIKALVNNCDEVINCGDAGQEGELIQRWVLQHAENKAPVKRLWISSLTDEAIREGFTDLKEGSDFDRLYAAGGSRAVGDWILGINATRLYTLKYGDGKGVLSIGRVQTPTLDMIVRRQKEIEGFTPEPFWELKTTYRETNFNATKGRYLKKEEAEADLAQAKEHEFVISSFTKKEGKEHPPKLFDLTSLQVECNRKFGSSADDTLKNVQSLYERKLVTYPRTDSQYLSNDLYLKIPGILGNLKPYEQYTKDLLSKKIRKSKKVFDDKKVTDHHAIIPTGVFPGGLALAEKQVYDVITRRFLAAFHPDCIVSNTTVLGKAGEQEFKATGKQILDQGWRILYGSESTSKDDAIMPTFEEGESGPHEPELAEKMTQAPKPYTEATLLRAMETAGKQVDDDKLRDLMKENGIGRPSTRANIIETLFRRKYIVRERKNLKATSTGVQLIDTIQNELLKSAELTGQWEFKLRQIEKGEYDVRTFMNEMHQMVTAIVNDVKQRPNRRIEIVDEKAKAAAKKKTSGPITCPKCGEGQMLKGNSAFGCSRYKDGCKTLVPFEAFGKKLTDKQITDLLKKGKTGNIKGFEQDGTKKEGHLAFDENFVLQLHEKKAADLTCPKCGQGQLMEGKSAFGCSNWKNGCDFRIPFEVMSKKIGKKQVEQLLTKKKTAKLKGFNRASGESFAARLVLTDDHNLTLEE